MGIFKNRGPSEPVWVKVNFPDFRSIDMCPDPLQSVHLFMTREPPIKFSIGVAREAPMRVHNPTQSGNQ